MSVISDWFSISGYCVTSRLLSSTCSIWVILHVVASLDGYHIGIDTSHKQWTHTEGELKFSTLCRPAEQCYIDMLAAQAEKINDTEFTMEYFTYRNNIVESIMFRNLEQTNFTGITVSYNSLLCASTANWLKHGSVLLGSDKYTFDSLGIRTVSRLRICQQYVQLFLKLTSQYQRDSKFIIVYNMLSIQVMYNRWYDAEQSWNSLSVWGRKRIPIQRWCKFI